MKKSDCLFCKISSGEIPSVKIREDENFLAILDIFPNRPGMTLVLPREHYDSDVFEIDDEMLGKYILAVKKVIKLLKKGLGVKKVGIVMEGEQVNHAHFRLYPFYDDGGFHGNIGSGEKADIDELKKLAEKIKNSF